MPLPSVPLARLGFLTIGSFDAADPGPGHERTLAVVELGERLGLDSAWVRHRHLQYGISSPLTVLAAASQRTRRIELGTAVTPLAWENPLRLAEDLATVDVLSGGRLNPGVSVGPPMHWDDVKAALYPHTADTEDFGYDRVARLLRLVAGEPASTFSGREGVVEEFSARVQPHSPGLRSRMWYGGGSLRSARWAGEQGMSFLTSSVVKAGDAAAGDGADFAAIQRAHVRAFRAAHPDGDAARVSQGLVVIPTDSASADQRARYAAYVEARTPRTAAPQGPAQLLFARDLLGTSEQIAEELYAHAGFQEVTEVVFALPFSFADEDYAQILTDIATRLGPALGWRPHGIPSAGSGSARRNGIGARPAGPPS
ncbi:LLM class flavin-dependent oxidoreductase [Geodermatophilus sabuli]|uniref:LLM class flavin-dependent oxidoreductase n=1 Tax=Geodermatophilus sabuli TaxID=1564158 RepID=A0A7K3VXV3_9ACTN|nr:LLM class flavin-dependent oxidoreductase [Geodermatophilus sabuli]NEK56457.1 LLM class flavin-dependent oxidoreductase [Geodermatophilus sabuli]